MRFFQKIYIHLSLTIKGIFNLFILIILLISLRNINILKSYQKLYLVISLIIWILIVINYFGKLCLIIILKLLNKKFQCEGKIKMLLYISWLTTSISAYAIMLIAFLYDILQIYKGNLTFVIYECIFSGLCIIFICFTINDFYHLQIIFNLICEKAEFEVKKEVAQPKEEVTETKVDEDEFEFDLKVLENKMFESTKYYNMDKQKAL